MIGRLSLCLRELVTELPCSAMNAFQVFEFTTRARNAANLSLGVATTIEDGCSNLSVLCIAVLAIVAISLAEVALDGFGQLDFAQPITVISISDTK